MDAVSLGNPLPVKAQAHTIAARPHICDTAITVIVRSRRER